VVEFVVEFFKKGKLLKTWNATFLALAPKIATAKDLKDFRPISLCNVVYKIITKYYLNDLNTSSLNLFLNNKMVLLMGDS